MSDQWAAFERLLAALDRLEILYAVGGSLASSVHGVPRATVDVDLLVDLPDSKIEPLVEDLKAEFFAEADLIRDAVRAGRPFNLIHYKSAYKFDLFPLPDDPYYRTEFDRRFEVNLSVTESQFLGCQRRRRDSYETRLVSSGGRGFNSPVERRSGNCANEKA